LAADATRLYYRYAGQADWRELPLTQVAEDSGTSKVLGWGVLYRATLNGITNVERAFVDLKIELRDIAGNTSAIEVTPALSIGPEVVPRKKAVR